jgi:hypothetical protein
MHIFKKTLIHGRIWPYIISNPTISLLETIDENLESSYWQIGHATSDTPAIRELIDQTF